MKFIFRISIICLWKNFLHLCLLVWLCFFSLFSCRLNHFRVCRFIRISFWVFIFILTFSIILSFLLPFMPFTVPTFTTFIVTIKSFVFPIFIFFFEVFILPISFLTITIIFSKVFISLFLLFIFTFFFLSIIFIFPIFLLLFCSLFTLDSSVIVKHQASFEEFKVINFMTIQIMRYEDKQILF